MIHNCIRHNTRRLSMREMANTLQQHAMITTARRIRPPVQNQHRRSVFRTTLFKGDLQNLRPDLPHPYPPSLAASHGTSSRLVSTDSLSSKDAEKRLAAPSAQGVTSK